MLSYLPVLIAILGGVAVVIQARFNGIMDRGMGTLESVFITYGLGGLIIALVMIGLRGGNLAAFRTAPWYVALAGVCGLVIIGAISYSVPRLGLAVAFTVMVTTQFVLGAVFDHFGWLGGEIRPLSLQKAAGILILLLGVWLIIRE
ncbi:MAG TPA: DMT family transporter [Chloroflexota bacterium]|nr:DMT family transporter [Chloroflexota bacterium]HUM69687.1 DMT family transporter [Chloroflexota bacterium]